MRSRSANTYIKYLAGALFVAVILGYAYFQSELLAHGPQFTFIEPASGTMFEEPLVNIRGKVERVSDITLNGDHIFIDEEGNFSEKILLSPGQNIITLEAQDKFGRKITKILELIYK